MGIQDRRRGESRELKKDQQIRRETLDELGSEIVQDGTGPNLPQSQS